MRADRLRNQKTISHRRHRYVASLDLRFIQKALAKRTVADLLGSTQYSQYPHVDQRVAPASAWLAAHACMPTTTTHASQVMANKISSYTK
jgi:hypothetical protein